MTYLPPVFQKILGDTILAYGLPKVEYGVPRPPEEVRRELSKQSAPAEFSADAI